MIGDLEEPVDDSIRLLEIFMPQDGWLVSFAEAYMDESYRKGSPYLTVAGYLFRRSGARGFAKAWGPYLNRKMGYRWFHMTDLIARKDIFKNRKDGEDDIIARRLIEETHKWSAFGFAVTVDEPVYERLIGGRWGLPPKAFGFALLQAMILVRRWTARAEFDGQISYFFEQGNDHQKEADHFLTQLVQKSPVNSARYRYRMHAFLPKETHWLHPADMLAWHWSLEMQRQEEEKRIYPVRGDLQALIGREQDKTMHYDAGQLAALADDLTRSYGAREPDWQTFNWEAFRRPDLSPSPA